MNPRSITTILDDLTPRQSFADDWSDVLERAGVREADESRSAWRRHKWLLLAAVIAAVLVPVAAATVAVTNWNGWWSSPPTHQLGLHPVTEPVVVQTGSWDGKRWQLVAYREGGEGDNKNFDGYCYSVSAYGPPPTAPPRGGGGCGGFIARPPDAPAGPAGITYASAESPGLPYWAAGPVVDTAVEVDIHLRDGDVLRLSTYAVPESFGHVRFYATPIPEVPQSSGQWPIKIVGINKNDAVVACMALEPASASC
jgi:hypothetical protein